MSMGSIHLAGQWACRSGHRDIAELLLDHGVYINATCYSLTRLMWACNNSSPSLCWIVAAI